MFHCLFFSLETEKAHCLPTLAALGVQDHNPVSGGTFEQILACAFTLSRRDARWRHSATWAEELSATVRGFQSGVDPECAALPRPELEPTIPRPLHRATLAGPAPAQRLRKSQTIR